jgi:hypothetical protein
MVGIPVVFGVITAKNLTHYKLKIISFEGLMPHTLFL